MTKIVGAFCGSLLVLLLGSWAAELVYHVGGDHGDGHHQAYSIETGNEEAAEPEPEVPFEEIYANADAGAGERVFNKCKACHKLEQGANGTGPYLNGVVGRAVGAADGFGYSGALQKVVQEWTPENLFHFLENPKSYAPGTAMNFAGLSKADDRADVIAYLAATN